MPISSDFADDYPGLWAAEQFIAGEANQVRPGCQRFLDGRLVGQPIAGGIEQRTGTEVIHTRNTPAVRQGDDIFPFRFFGEADHFEI